MTSDHTVTAEASVTSKNLSKVVLLRLAQYPFMALFAVLVPRMMRPDAYGHYALFVSLVGMVSAFLDLGITEIAARAVPQLQQLGDRAGIVTFFSRMLGFKTSINLALGSACALGLVLGSRYLPVRYFVWPLLIVVIIGDLSGTAYGVLFGLNRLAYCSARDPMRRALGLIAVIVLFEAFGLSGAISAVVFVEAILATLYLRWTRHWLSLEQLAPSWSYAAPLLRYGLLFYLSWGILNVWQRLGNTLIGYLQGDFKQIALFDLSNQIFLTATGFTLFLVTSLAPMFTRLRLEAKEDKLVDWSRRICTYSQILCTSALAGWVLVGAQLVPLVIGPQYRGLYGNVALLLCGTWPMVVVQLGLALAMAYAEPRWYLSALCVAVTSFIASSLILIPSYGALGCSAATLLSCVCCAVAIGLRYRRNMRRSLGPGLMAVALGGAILAPCWLYRGSFVRNIVLLLAFLLAYGAGLWITRIVKSSEVRQAWLALRYKEA